MRAMLCTVTLMLSVFVFVVAILFESDSKESTVPVLKRHFEKLPDGRLAANFYAVDTYVAPTYIQCSNITPSGSFSVALNAAGEAYFGDQAADVNAAIAAAVEDAVAVFPDKEGVYCQDACTAMLSGVESGSANDATATVQIVLNAGANDEICWPDGNVPNTGIRVTATAPGVSGVDISPIVTYLNGMAFPVGYPSGDQSEIESLISELLVLPLVAAIDFESGGTSRVRVTAGSGGFVEVSTDDTSAVSMKLQVSSDVFLYATWSEAATTGFWYVGGGTVTGNGTPGEGGIWDSAHAFRSDTSFFPANVPLANSDGVTPRTIDQTINLDNTGGETDVYTPSGDTASLTASGSMTIAISAAPPKMTDPGIPHTHCMWNVWYRSRRPIDWSCGRQQATVLRFWYQGPTQFKHPPGEYPLCEVPVWLEPDQLPS